MYFLIMEMSQTFEINEVLDRQLTMKHNREPTNKPHTHGQLIY